MAEQELADSTVPFGLEKEMGLLSAVFSVAGGICGQMGHGAGSEGAGVV